MAFERYSHNRPKAKEIRTQQAARFRNAMPKKVGLIIEAASTSYSSPKVTGLVETGGMNFAAGVSAPSSLLTGDKAVNSEIGDKIAFLEF